jgi:hypothetical protein
MVRVPYLLRATDLVCLFRVLAEIGGTSKPREEAEVVSAATLPDPACQSSNLYSVLRTGSGFAEVVK